MIRDNEHTTAGYRLYWRSAVTNADGYFVNPERWTLSVKYKLHWDADDFVLQEGNRWGGHHVTEGPTKKSDWNRTLTERDAQYATIFTAAHTYYYKDIDGLEGQGKMDFLLLD